jgi:3-methyladenine DNA glycosylase AlkD
LRRELEQELASAGDPQRAAAVSRFFKTGKGEYGEGDRFLGIPVPALRRIALRYTALSSDELERLLASLLHEHRAAALEILVEQYERGDAAVQKQIVDFYLSHTSGINNWDLVDTSAPYIMGHYLRGRSTRILDRLAKSPNVWERRIAIVSTLGLIKAGDLEVTYRIAAKLLADKHDLIQKAVGWALRDTGKASRVSLINFLEMHYASISRTALRYAIEHFGPDQRKSILKGQFDGLRTESSNAAAG